MLPNFHYVYILSSSSCPGRHYTGLTDNLTARLEAHNAAQVPHTAKFLPWTLDSFFAFSTREKAAAFERYLKSHSGRAFSMKHF